MKLNQVMSHNIFRPSPTIYFLKKLFLTNTSRETQYIKHDWRKFESNTFISDFGQTDSEKIFSARKIMLTFQ